MTDPYKDVFAKKEDALSEIADLLKKIKKLKKKYTKSMEETSKVLKESEIYRNQEIKENRKEYYGKRAQSNERKEREKCLETNRLFKELQKHSFSGPFFDTLLSVLSNHQGNLILKKNIYLKSYYFFSFIYSLSTFSPFILSVFFTLF